MNPSLPSKTFSHLTMNSKLQKSKTRNKDGKKTLHKIDPSWNHDCCVDPHANNTECGVKMRRIRSSMHKIHLALQDTFFCIDVFMCGAWMPFPMEDTTHNADTKRKHGIVKEGITRRMENIESWLVMTDKMFKFFNPVKFNVRPSNKISHRVRKIFGGMPTPPKTFCLPSAMQTFWFWNNWNSHHIGAILS